MVHPRQLSFQGALHEVRSFEQAHLYDPVQIAADLPRLLQLIGRKRVGDRPDRYEAASSEAASQAAPAAADDAEEGPSVNQTWDNTL